MAGRPRQTVRRSRRRHRRRRPRPRPPGAARGRARAARPALARVEPVLDGADAAARRDLSDRFGGAHAFFCNSGAEAIEAAMKFARKATGSTGIVALENSFHGRTLGALSVDGPAGERAAFEPLVPGVTFASSNDSARSRPRSATTRRIFLEPVRAKAASIPLHREFLARLARSPTSTVRCSSSTRCRPASAGPAASSPGRSSASTRRRDAREGPRERPAARCAARRGRRADGLRAGRPRHDLRRQPRRLRGGVAVVDTVDDDLLAHVRELSDASCATGSPSSARCGGSGSCSRLSSTAPPRRSSKRRSRTVCVIGTTAGERTLRLTPPLTLSLDEAALGARLS